MTGRWLAKGATNGPGDIDKLLVAEVVDERRVFEGGFEELVELVAGEIIDDGGVDFPGLLAEDLNDVEIFLGFDDAAAAGEAEGDGRKLGVEGFLRGPTEDAATAGRAVLGKLGGDFGKFGAVFQGLKGLDGVGL